MLKFLRSIMGGARSVASIVASLEKVRSDLAAHAADKIAEREAHRDDAAAATAKADAAHAEAVKAAEVHTNIAGLLGA